jgi:hypothetical protein
MEGRLAAWYKSQSASVVQTDTFLQASAKSIAAKRRDIDAWMPTDKMMLGNLDEPCNTVSGTRKYFQH